MSVFWEALRWVIDPGHRHGLDGVFTCIAQHLVLSAAGLGAATAIALPVGLAAGHARTRIAEVAVVQFAGAARAIPTFAVLALAFLVVLRIAPGLSFGILPTLIALTVLGIPPILVNTAVGIRGVDPDVKEAARGMGLTGGQLLRTVEMPIGMPLILTGLRIAALQIIATATLAAVIAGGGLGRPIVDGFAQQDQPMMIGGVYLVAALAMLVEGAFSLLARRIDRVGTAAGSREAARTA